MGQGGAGRVAVTADPKAGLLAILTGMGSLSYGEQAGERMKLGLMLNDPEEEHDCFSDSTTAIITTGSASAPMSTPAATSASMAPR